MRFVESTDMRLREEGETERNDKESKEQSRHVAVRF
jgi:hypothetical protein